MARGFTISNQEAAKIEESIEINVRKDIAAGRTDPKDYELAKSIARRGIYRAAELDYVTKYRVGKETLSPAQKKARSERDARRRAGYEQISREDLEKAGMTAGSRGSEGISRGPTVIKGGFTQGTGARGGFGQPSVQETAWESRSEQIQRQSREAIRQRYTQAYAQKFGGVRSTPYTQTKYQTTPTRQLQQVEDPRNIPYSKTPLKGRAGPTIARAKQEEMYREQLDDPSRYKEPSKVDTALRSRFGLLSQRYKQDFDIKKDKLKYGKYEGETAIVYGGGPSFGPTRQAASTGEQIVKRAISGKQAQRRYALGQEPKGPEDVIFAVQRGRAEGKAARELAKTTVTPAWVPKPVKKWVDLPRRGYEDFSFRAARVKRGITEEGGPLVKKYIPQARESYKKNVLEARRLRQELKEQRKVPGAKSKYKQSILYWESVYAEQRAGAAQMVMEPGELAAEAYTGAATVGVLKLVGPVAKPLAKGGGKAIEWAGKRYNIKTFQKTPEFFKKHGGKVVAGTFGAVYAGSETYAIATDPRPARRSGQTPLRLVTFLGGAKAGELGIRGMEKIAYTRVARPRVVVSEEPVLTGGKATQYETEFKTAGEAKVFLEGQEPRKVRLKVDETVKPTPTLIGDKGALPQPGKDYISRFKLTSQVEGKKPITKEGYGTIKKQGPDLIQADLRYGKRQKASVGMVKMGQVGDKQLWRFEQVSQTKKQVESVGGIMSLETFKGMAPYRVVPPEQYPKTPVPYRKQFGKRDYLEVQVPVKAPEKQVRFKQEETTSIYGKTMFGIVPTTKGEVVDIPARPVSNIWRGFGTSKVKPQPYYGVTKQTAVTKPKVQQLPYSGPPARSSRNLIIEGYKARQRAKLESDMYKYTKDLPKYNVKYERVGQQSQLVGRQPKFEKEVPKFTGPSPSSSLIRSELKISGKKAFSLRERVKVGKSQKIPKSYYSGALGGKLVPHSKTDQRLTQRGVLVVGQKQKAIPTQKFKIKAFTEQIQQIDPIQQFKQKITEKPFIEQKPKYDVFQSIVNVPPVVVPGPNPWKGKTPRVPTVYPPFLGARGGRGWKRRGYFRQKKGFAPSLLGRAYAESGLVIVSPRIRVPGFAIRGEGPGYRFPKVKKKKAKRKKRRYGKKKK